MVSLNYLQTSHRCAISFVSDETHIGAAAARDPGQDQSPALGYSDTCTALYRIVRMSVRHLHRIRSFADEEVHSAQFRAIRPSFLPSRGLFLLCCACLLGAAKGEGPKRPSRTPASASALRAGVEIGGGCGIRRSPISTLLFYRDPRRLCFMRFAPLSLSSFLPPVIDPSGPRSYCSK